MRRGPHPNREPGDRPVDVAKPRVAVAGNPICSFPAGFCLIYPQTVGLRKMESER